MTRHRYSKANGDGRYYKLVGHAREVREAYAGGVSAHTLAEEWGVCRMSISYCLRGITHADEGGPIVASLRETTARQETPTLTPAYFAALGKNLRRDAHTYRRPKRHEALMKRAKVLDQGGRHVNPAPAPRRPGLLPWEE